MTNITESELSLLEQRVQEKLERYPTLRKRIGSTVYEVNVYFNSDAKETMNEKILRIIKNDLNLTADNDIIGLPQTVRLAERSSI